MLRHLCYLRLAPSKFSGREIEAILLKCFPGHILDLPDGSRLTSDLMNVPEMNPCMEHKEWEDFNP